MAHGRYTIVGKLADGGMAEIFLAMQHGAEGFQKPVVLKRVLSAFSADPQFRNMFLDEAHISMTLSHGNIVQVLDVGVSGQRTFLVLELVEGWDLEHVMERAQATGPEHPWPPSLALYVTAQICRGLAYAHAKRGPDGRPLGIVHRDVSPNNVLISEQGEVKLADFGIAKAETKREQTLAGVIKGKIGFMSPEQALGRPLDARADLFSVGTVMYLMLTGQRPFDAGSELESMMRAQRAEYRPPGELNPYLSPEATAIVSRAMQSDTTARYQTADQMLVDVERVLRSQYHSAGQTELKLWLGELAQRDGVAPIGRVQPRDGDSALPVFVDEGGDLSVGSSVELSDIDGSAAATVISMLANAPSPVSVGPQSSLLASVDASLASPGLRVARIATPLVASESPSAPTARSAPGISPVGLPAADLGAAARDTSAPSVTAPTLANRRMPRRGGIGLGLVLGALCMLGAIFAIRWLAQWAGRESSVTTPVAGPVAVPVAVPVLVAGPMPTPGPVGVAVPTSTPAPDAATAAPVAWGAVAAADRAPGSPVAVETTADMEDDEDRLLNHVLPDAATVIGEDEAEESASARPALTKIRPEVKTRAKETERGRVTSVSRPQPKPIPRAQPVQIRITTSPLGAVVRTKKQVLGRTPLAVRFNPGNTYELTFVKRGYLTNSRRLAVAIGRPQSISVAMKKAPPPPRRTFFRGR